MDNGVKLAANIINKLRGASNTPPVEKNQSTESNNDWGYASENEPQQAQQMPGENVTSAIPVQNATTSQEVLQQSVPQAPAPTMDNSPAMNPAPAQAPTQEILYEQAPVQPQMQVQEPAPQQFSSNEMLTSQEPPKQEVKRTIIENGKILNNDELDNFIESLVK